MRNLIIIGLLAAVAAPVSAQSVGEVRRGERDVRQQQQQLQDARRYGDRNDIRDERRDVQDARQELREDRRDLRDDRRDRRAYVAPYRNWTYRPVAAGYRLQPGFYGQRYIIANPSFYRLQPAARNQQWVRYGNDLLLVNIRNGRVLQVVRSRY
ncbi:RcnB family protein [Sandarakinorhabdus sp. DWP1-3-1]|uniref:RcnB family protein n=1 Tax=Sandarakinorhabdus sp. DWP1-3-1 TaxID=2804627 RepID=UPI003CECCDED